MQYSQPLNANEYGDCPSCHRPLSKDRSKELTWLANGFCVLVAVMALAFIWIARPAISRRLSGATSTTTTVQTVPVVASVQLARTVMHNTSGVTAAQFKKLRVGMTYNQVRRVLGSKGSCTGSARIGGVPTALYHWQNPNGSSISVELRRDRLAFKSNFRLSGVDKAPIVPVKVPR